MKKVYNIPEFELKKFEIRTDILAESDDEGNLPGGGGEIDTLNSKNPRPINGSGFGW